MMGRKIVKQLPNTLTMLNMLLGVSVLFMHICHRGEGHRPIACALILVCAFLDAIDGKLARLLKVESLLGKQMDSFADFASFGLAPMAVLLTHETVRQGGWLIYAVTLIYVASGAFRLARYNIGDYADHFVGLPITAAGCILAIVNLILHYTPIFDYRFSVSFVMAFICILSALMVSKIRVQRV
ncbi:MAG: CDP-alcohol phosphatidyltransferase family protein [Christensenellales bacterium]|jgi:CDP-diacylglycerol--serine O-phosphatidyltransferase